MLLRLLLLFTLVPLVELAILLRIGALVGAGPTVLLVLGTGVAGAWMARREGLRSWRAVERTLAEGRLPAEELLHGLLILVAGVLLVTPGVLTDLAGILLLVRPVRRRLLRGLRERFAATLAAGPATPRDGSALRFLWRAGPAAGGGGRRPPRAASPEGSGPEPDRETPERRPRVIEL